MTPNLFVGLQTLATPHRWFSRKWTKPSEANVAGIEHFDRPIPGQYKYIADAWNLILADNPTDLPPDLRDSLPHRIVYSHVLQRPLLEAEYLARTCQAPLPPLPRSRPTSMHSPDPAASVRSSSRPSSSRRSSHNLDEPVGFIRLDDGITWVNDRDARGRELEGPFRPFCIDEETGALRPMVKRDDPAWREQRRREHESGQRSRNRSRLSVEVDGAGPGSRGGSREGSVVSERAGSLQVGDARRGSRVEDLKGQPESRRSSRSLLPLLVPEGMEQKGDARRASGSE